MTIQLQSLAENKYVLAESNKKQFYLYVELKATEAEQSTKRLPLNISLVLDKSGSMQGDKLDYAKKAVNFVIDNLNSEDYVSVVEYDRNVKLVSASSKVLNKTLLQQKINNIRAGSTTNLSGGMLEGYNQVKTTKQEGFVNRVLLLSDGLANVGVVQPQQLQNIAQQRFREEGIGLSTFGVGSDFNELLMTGLSEYGGANYYFIESADKIPTIFAEELEGLLAVVAQNTQLTLNFPNQYLRCKKVYGYPAQINANQIQVNFNDVFSKEEKAVLIEFDIVNAIDGDLHFDIQAVFDDVLNLAQRNTLKETLTVQMTTDSAVHQANVEAKTSENIALFLATDLFNQAIKAEEARNIPQAKLLLQQAKAYLEAYFKLFAPTTALQQLLEQINNFYSKLDTIREMPRTEYASLKKSSRYASYNLMRKKPRS